MTGNILVDYDTVIFGTGISESVLSSALSRSQKKILHLDSNSYYADIWASKTLTDFVLWLSRTSAQESHIQEVINEDGTISISMQSEDQSVLLQDWFWAPRLRQEMEANQDNLIMPQQEPVKPDIRGDRKSLVSLHQLANQNRRYNIDITPKLIYNRSKLMDALNGTGLGFYSDFQRVTKNMHIKKNGRILKMPHDFPTIATCTKITEPEKQHIADFLQFIKKFQTSDQSVEQNLKSKSFKSFLEKHGIESTFAKVTLLETFAMSHNQSNAWEGVHNLKKYLHSLTNDVGSPLSWIHYGSMELAESFCRHSAVCGTTFILRRSIEHCIIHDNKVVFASLCNGEKVKMDHLIMNARYAPLQWLDESKIRYVARAVFLTDSPLRPVNDMNGFTESSEDPSEDGANVLFYHLPGYKQPLTIIELSTKVRACPPSTWLVHMSLTLNNKGSQLQPAVSTRDIFQSISSLIFTDDEDNMTKPHTLLSAYFITRSYTEAVSTRSPMLPKNVYLTPGPDTEIDYDSNIVRASKIFEQLCPNDNFLPMLPTHHTEHSTTEQSTTASAEHS